MRNSRRRRIILRDEIEPQEKCDANPAGKDKAPSTGTGTVPYTSGARIENQPRMIDFVPTRAFVVAGLVLMLVAVIALLNIAHFRIFPYAAARGVPADALKLSVDQGLLSWVASFLLLATAFFCFQVYQVRRYREDDFSGSYRVWIWLAVGFIVASIDATARISPILAGLIASFWETGVLADDRTVWTVLVGLPALVVCIRLVVELWRSRIAIGTIAIAAAAYLLANFVRLDFLSPEPTDQSVVKANTIMVAHCFLFFTVVWYARYVLLESQGLIVLENRRPMTAQEDIDEIDEQLAGVENADSQSAARSETDSGQNLEDSTDSSREVEPNTLKIMGQKVQSKKKRRRESQRNSGRRAA